MRKTVLITGATSGIGEATALLLAQNNFNLIVTGRRHDRLMALKENN
jgi:3-hydroxy acid dehydrogenase / malonic semialdehyde reductase